MLNTIISWYCTADRVIFAMIFCVKVTTAATGEHKGVGPNRLIHILFYVWKWRRRRRAKTNVLSDRSQITPALCVMCEYVHKKMICRCVFYHRRQAVAAFFHFTHCIRSTSLYTNANSLKILLTYVEIGRRNVSSGRLNYFLLKYYFAPSVIVIMLFTIFDRNFCQNGIGIWDSRRNICVVLLKLSSLILPRSQNIQCYDPDKPVCQHF